MGFQYGNPDVLLGKGEIVMFNFFNPYMMPQMNGFNLIGQLQQFIQNFHGDPQQQVQQLINSGRINQAQYDQAVQATNQFMNMFRR